MKKVLLWWCVTLLTTPTIAWSDVRTSVGGWTEWMFCPESSLQTEVCTLIDFSTEVRTSRIEQAVSEHGLFSSEAHRAMRIWEQLTLKLIHEDLQSFGLQAIHTDVAKRVIRYTFAPTPRADGVITPREMQRSEKFI